MTLSFIGVSAPQFVTGLILFYIFAYWLNLLPTGGFGAVNVILPAVTLGIAGGGWYSRMMRSSMVDVLHQDYIDGALGLDERSVLFVRLPQRRAADRGRSGRRRHLHVGRGGGEWSMAGRASPLMWQAIRTATSPSLGWVTRIFIVLAISGLMRR
jgi:hypothetical protein